MVCKLRLMVLVLFVGCTHNQIRSQDQFLWLEDGNSQKVKSWVNKKNEKSVGFLAKSPSFRKKYEKSIKAQSAIGNSPKIDIIGQYAYTIYRHFGSSRGVWKRTQISRLNSNVKNWETVFDLDKYNKSMNKSFLISGIECLKPSGELCMIGLASKGLDTPEYREFNTKKKSFVKNGFFIPSSKATLAWIDKNRLVVSTEQNKEKQTNAGFSRNARVLDRIKGWGGVIEDLSIPKDYLGLFYETAELGDKAFPMVYRYFSQEKSDVWYFYNEKWRRIPVPEGTPVAGVVGRYFVVTIKGRWREFKPGDVLALNFDDLLADRKRFEILRIHKNQENEFLGSDTIASGDHVLVQTLKNVKSSVKAYSLNNGKFRPLKLNFKENTSVKIEGLSGLTAKALLSYEGFLTPKTLTLVNLKNASKKVISKGKSAFDTKGMVVEQKWTQSKDGVAVPYFLVGKKSVIKKGGAPVVVRVYGAYGYSLLPKYAPLWGVNWFSQGGLWVVANVRGGGEFGEKWHLDGVREKKKNSILDLISVSEDLIKRGITTKDKIGIYGGSMGGITVLGAMTMRPDLFSAVVATVPMVDILAGKRLTQGNWIGELGDPDKPSNLKYILEYAPYENVKKGVTYPSLFSYTTSSDDRVKPGNARKMIEKLKTVSPESSVYYYEASEGGHSGGGTKNQKAYWKTMVHEFFSKKLGL